MMDMNVLDIIVNNGVAVAVIIWFMFKNTKDMDTFRNIMQQENQLTRDTLNELKIVIAKLGEKHNE